MSKAEIVKAGESAIAPAPGGGSIDALLSAAVDKGASVEALEKLVGLRERMMEQEARAAFHNAVAELHARIGSIPKNKTAKFNTKSGGSVSYRYADLHQIATSLRRHTGDLGLSWRWDTESGGNAVVVTCTASHRLGHSEKSTWRAPIEQGNPMTSAPQKEKIATTFAQRVTLIQVFGLTDTDDDVDGQMPYGGDGPNRLSDGQVANLLALCDEIGEPHVGKMLRWAGVDRVEDIPSDRYAACVRALEAKR